MKIYIFADMEGISGISDAAYVLPGEAKYAYGCKYLTREINICAAACLEAGADEVIVDGCTFADIRGIKLYDEGKERLTALSQAAATSCCCKGNSYYPHDDGT